MYDYNTNHIPDTPFRQLSETSLPLLPTGKKIYFKPDCAVISGYTLPFPPFMKKQAQTEQNL
ncbi:hypothetical protein DMB45_08395 [Sanguibacteroides justesenii]|nr:hypothetical protein DMB45_08395 [Sanguibacteroides justesenii]